MQARTPHYSYLSLTVRYGSVLFPFDNIQFEDALPRYGYIPTETKTIHSFGLRREISGSIARKGDVIIRIDTPKKVLGVHAPDLESLLEEMECVEGVLAEELGFEGSSIAQYYEFLASLTVRANKNPVECWVNYSKQSPFLEKASRIIGCELSAFGVRLSPKGEAPNQEDWLDIRIEPPSEAATSKHQLTVVYRNAIREKVFSFVRDFKEYLEKLLSLVEEG